MGPSDLIWTHSPLARMTRDTYIDSHTRMQTHTYSYIPHSIIAFFNYCVYRRDDEIYHILEIVNLRSDEDDEDDGVLDAVISVGILFQVSFFIFWGFYV